MKKNHISAEVRQKKFGFGRSFELKKKRRLLKKNQFQNSTSSDEESPLEENKKEISEKGEKIAKGVAVIKTQGLLDSNWSDFAGARVKNKVPAEVRQKKSSSGPSFELKKKKKVLEEKSISKLHLIR